jgi:hypothetical protein
MLFWRKFFEDGHYPSPGLFAAAPYLELQEVTLISYVKTNRKYLAFELRTAGQGKLTTLRCENRKIRHENEI